MKVKRFLLQDNVDRNYTYLVAFTEEVELEEIENAIWKVKEAFPTSYTNEDCLKALKELGNYDLIDLFDLKVVEY